MKNSLGKIISKTGLSCLILVLTPIVLHLAALAEPPIPSTLATAKKAEPVLSEKEQSETLLALQKMHLQIPITGFNPERIKGSFDESRGGKRHGAADFPAQRNTAIHAVADGQVAKIFESKAGGHTIYQYDQSKKFVFYYAHMEKYSDGIAEGQKLKRGDTIGFVGSSGDAQPDAPHLHFSIGLLKEPQTWWKVFELDPYEVFKQVQ